jgi:hypothetical protein
MIPAPKHAIMNLHAVCIQISQQVNYTTQMLQFLIPCHSQVSSLLWCEGLGHRLESGRDHEVCGQFIFPLGESNSVARVHTIHAISSLQCIEPSGLCMTIDWARIPKPWFQLNLSGFD